MHLVKCDVCKYMKPGIEKEASRLGKDLCLKDFERLMEQAALGIKIIEWRIGLKGIELKDVEGKQYALDIDVRDQTFRVIPIPDSSRKSKNL